MRNKIVSEATILILITLLGYVWGAGDRNATNVCTDCYQYNGICNVTDVGFAVPLRGRTDMRLVHKLEKGDVVVDSSLKCVNHGYKVTGLVFEHICFWTLPNKCEAVMPSDSAKNKGTVRTACRSCAQYCSCSMGKDMGVTNVANSYVIALCTTFVMINKIFNACFW